MKTKHHNQNQDAVALLAQAAAFGPGFQGQRQTATPSQRTELREKLAEQSVDVPPFLEQEHTWVDRRAKLFEAGDFPDKGVTVTTETLQALERAFHLPVPVLIEHSKSPLEIGYLTHVEADGGQLFGTVALTKEANDLIEKSGAHALSLGLDQDMKQIVEVSLVKKPRVASARLFTGEVFQQDWRSRYEQLADAVEADKAAAEVQKLVAEGKLTPAQAPFAQAIMQSNGAVVFDGESRPVRSLFSAFLDALPAHLFLKELAPSPNTPAPSMDHDSQAFYERYFPGLSLEEIARHSGRAL